MHIDQDGPTPSTGPLIREFRPHRRRHAPSPGWPTWAAVIVLCLCLAAASIAGPALHLFLH
jgi:hypothetical protein